jgi:tripartite-type tricarboxylate transporter receptor subunit TctC
MADAATQARFAEVGVEPFADPSPQALAAHLATEIAKWEPVLRSTGARTE